MSECGFWFWFTRPFAEFLGGMALVVGFALIYVAFLFFTNWLTDRKQRKAK